MLNNCGHYAIRQQHVKKVSEASLSDEHYKLLRMQSMHHGARLVASVMPQSNRNPIAAIKVNNKQMVQLVATKIDIGKCFYIMCRIMKDITDGKVAADDKAALVQLRDQLVASTAEHPAWH